MQDDPNDCGFFQLVVGQFAHVVVVVVVVVVAAAAAAAVEEVVVAVVAAAAEIYKLAFFD
jgi:hypothetical protein